MSINEEKVQFLNQAIKEKILQLVPSQGKSSTLIDGLAFSRREEANIIESCFYKPAVAIIIQGYKYSKIGSEQHNYGENQCLVTGVDVPSTFYVDDASSEKPFLAVSLDLDKYLITRLSAEMPAPQENFNASCQCSKAISLVAADHYILDAFLRLIELLEVPEQIPVLAPMIVQEIHYRLLLSPQGCFLRKLNTIGSQSNQISKAVSWLKENYKKPLFVDDLAKSVNMASSTFHRHFKEITTISPLQFHKRLRLYEAQRLMLMENENANSAALLVGYESPTQFNREYKRLFGEPPHRSVSKSR